MDPLDGLRQRISQRVSERLEANMNADDIKELARMGKAAMHADLLKVRPIANGFIMDYDDVEEYEVKIPVYDPTHSPRGPGDMKTETRRKWKVVRKEVYCADAVAIKLQIDEALRLSEKIKYQMAQDSLSGEDELSEIGTVAAYSPVAKI